MKKNIFICHRPYHILRSCDFIHRERNPEAFNVLITFDVKLAGKDIYQRFSNNNIFYSSFDEVINISSMAVPSIKNIRLFYSYCKNRRKEYRTYIQNHFNADSLYFFSDDEIDIQLLVGLFLENKKKSLKSVLVDEGMVTYSKRTHNSSWKYRLYSKIVTRTIGLKYFNYIGAYGSSNFYNHSIANNPERAFFKQPIDKMPLLSEEVCEKFRKRINVSFYSHYYYLYITTHLTPFEKEKKVINEIKKILAKYGINLYFKLHPQQDEALYKAVYSNDFFIDKSYPVELFYGKKAIIGGIGSSSIYNAVLQGYNAMDLSLLFDSKDLSFASMYGWLDITTIDSYQSFEKQIQIILNN